MLKLQNVHRSLHGSTTPRYIDGYLVSHIHKRQRRKNIISEGKDIEALNNENLGKFLRDHGIP